MRLRRRHGSEQSRLRLAEGTRAQSRQIIRKVLSRTPGKLRRPP